MQRIVNIDSTHLHEQQCGRSETVAPAPAAVLLLLLLLLLPLILATHSFASCILFHMCCSWRLSPMG